MSTSPAPVVTGKPSGQPAGSGSVGAPIPVAGAAAASTDFLAMFAQMLQEPPAEAGELAIDLLGGDTADTDLRADDAVADDDLLDPAALGDEALIQQILALAIPGAGVSAPMTPATGKADAAAAPSAIHATPVAANAKGGAGDDAALLAELASLPDDEPATGSVATTTPSTGSVTPTTGTPTHWLNHAASLTTTGAEASTDVATTPARLQTSVGSAAWAQELGTRLTFMATEGHHSASLRLSPEHLGPLEVRIDMNDDKASVWFGAQHADTRAALTDALPRLRELFAASGMMLTDAGVRHEAPRQEARDNEARLARALNGDPAGATTSVTSVTNRSLLDLYA